MWHLKYIILLLAVIDCLINDCNAQFKILGITSGRPNNNGEALSLVQIKPLQLNEKEIGESRSFRESSLSSIQTVENTTTTTDRPTSIENQTSKIIKLQIMDSSVARNITNREGKLQYENHRTENDIINISPLKSVSLSGSSSSSHRRRATGSIKLTGESDLFYIQKPSSPVPFKKQQQPKENDVVSDFVLQRYKRRKYKSKCRCERIWNCPRIQISIARCAPDFFMCCF